MLLSPPPPLEAIVTTVLLLIIITILTAVTKDLPTSPRFTPYDFLSRCKFSNFTYLHTFPRFPLRKKEQESYFCKNRTHDFRTSRCAGYLLDHSGDELTTVLLQHDYRITTAFLISPSFFLFLFLSIPLGNKPNRTKPNGRTRALSEKSAWVASYGPYNSSTGGYRYGAQQDGNTL